MKNQNKKKSETFSLQKTLLVVPEDLFFHVLQAKSLMLEICLLHQLLGYRYFWFLEKVVLSKIRVRGRSQTTFTRRGR